MLYRYLVYPSIFQHTISFKLNECLNCIRELQTNILLIDFYRMENCGESNYNLDDGKTSAELVKEYAEDNGSWLRDFKTAIEKMLRNGYSEENNNTLRDGPMSWFDVNLETFRGKLGFMGTWPINYSQ